MEDLIIIITSEVLGELIVLLILYILSIIWRKAKGKTANKDEGGSGVV